MYTYTYYFDNGNVINTKVTIDQLIIRMLTFIQFVY